jgi:uncharacterized iron-regulated protein
LLAVAAAALTVVSVAVGCATAEPAAARASDADAPCAATATWLEPATRKVLSHERLIRRAAEADVVLLGEVHDDADHHRWQLHTLAALYGRRKRMVIAEACALASDLADAVFVMAPPATVRPRSGQP